MAGGRGFGATSTKVKRVLGKTVGREATLWPSSVSLGLMSRVRFCGVPFRSGKYLLYFSFNYFSFVFFRVALGQNFQFSYGKFAGATLSSCLVG